MQHLFRNVSNQHIFEMLTFIKYLKHCFDTTFSWFLETQLGWIKHRLTVKRQNYHTTFELQLWPAVAFLAGVVVCSHSFAVVQWWTNEAAWSISCICWVPSRWHSLFNKGMKAHWIDITWTVFFKLTKAQANLAKRFGSFTFILSLTPFVSCHIKRFDIAMFPCTTVQLEPTV